MAFRNSGRSAGGTGGAPTVGTPTESIDIGDVFKQGTSGKYADAAHQHAFSGPPNGNSQPVSATGSDSDGTDTFPARSKHSHAHTAAMHGPGGHADLSGTFPTYTAADARYAGAIHGARHARGGADDLTGVFVPFDLVTAKGDVLVGNASGQLVKIPVGALGTFLTADPSQPGGIKWGTLPGVQSYDPSSFAIRKAMAPDGIDLSFNAQGGVGTPQSTNVALTATRIWGSGFLYAFTGTPLVNYATRPASGTRIDSLILRIDNANGGPGSATLTFKAGTSGAPPSMQQDDLSASSTAIYEVEISRWTVPTTGAATLLADVRPIARGVDNRDGSAVTLGTLDLGSTLTSVTFDNIPQTFRHLELRAVVRGSAAVSSIQIRGTCNQQTGGNYDNGAIVGDGSSIVGSRTINEASAYLGNAPGASAAEGFTFGTSRVDIFDYTSATKRRPMRIINSSDVGDAPAIIDALSTFFPLQAITRIDLFANTGGFVAGSKVSIVGIR